jgi:hypothetical protein
MGEDDISALVRLYEEAAAVMVSEAAADDA